MRMRGIALLLALLFIALPCMALGEDGVQIYDLTEMYGIEYADYVIFQDQDRLFVATSDFPDEDEADVYIFEVLYLSLNEKEPLFRYSTQRGGASNERASCHLAGEKLRAIFWPAFWPEFVEEDEAQWAKWDGTVDVLTIGADGKPE